MNDAANQVACRAFMDSSFADWNGFGRAVSTGAPPIPCITRAVERGTHRDLRNDEKLRLGPVRVARTNCLCTVRLDILCRYVSRTRNHAAPVADTTSEFGHCHVMAEGTKGVLKNN